ncbi:hypothetical protein [Flammeovirga sp. SJP92]|uniref:hypothetical protein n=1 Tax=Flammeovirga sp. SJP92 TaxID=1775430 RepID=UPI0007884E8C|nr:hypothetical protein [Flammeovirga sp. SJP92]KXX72753.1 hypothetical protein AVL50_32145 [Flammeovirga sp. SJP92]
MIYIVKQWRYKNDDSFIFELDATYKSFTDRDKAVEYIDKDVAEKKTLDSVNIDDDDVRIFKHVFHGKYGDKYQMIISTLDQS